MIWPLTPLQTGFLFHAVYDEGAPDVYTVQIGLDLDGTLDRVALKTAAEHLLARHANLRVGFRHRDVSRPVQVVMREVALPWTEVDISDQGEEKQAVTLERLRTEQRGQRFDLTRPPLLRFTLIDLGDGRHRLLLLVHHILLDGWSMPILLRELFALYTGEKLPPAVPYQSYLSWLSKQDRAATEAVWRAALDGFEELTRLAPARSGLEPSRPERLDLQLSAELTAALQGLARGLGVTLNTVIQAAWGVLLGRLTGRSDVVFGVTVSGRPAELAGSDMMVGLLINTLPLRLRLHPEETTASLLNRLQEEQAALLGHQHLGLAEIQRLAGHEELFDTLAVFENYPLDRSLLSWRLGDLRITGAQGFDTTHYPLTVQVLPGNPMRLRVGYHPARFDREAVQHLTERLLRVLEQLAADPQRLVGGLDILLPGERSRVLEDWNATARTVSPATLPALFEAQVARTPEAVAVVFEGEAMSYGELNARANRLAHLLIGH